MTVIPVLLGATAGAVIGPLVAAAASSTIRRQDLTWKLWPAATGCAAVIGGVLGWAHLPGLVTAALATAAAVALAAALVDAAEHRLPNALTVPLIVAGLVLTPVVTVITGWGSPLRGLIGLLVFSGWMLLVAVTGAGAGDVKLAAGVGLWLGWMSWWAFPAGVAVALLAMAGTEIVNRRFRGLPLSPLGPAISTGLAVGVIAAGLS